MVRSRDQENLVALREANGLPKIFNVLRIFSNPDTLITKPTPFRYHAVRVPNFKTGFSGISDIFKINFT